MQKIILLGVFAFLFFSKIISAASYAPIRDSNGNGLVITSSSYANAIGKAVLDSGGNAIDAAVAAGYALAVVHPAAGNIGGGGFAVIHLANGENVTLDFREKAPIESTKDMFLDRKGNVIPNVATIGYLSAAVPGTVKGLNAMLDKYGTKKLEELMQPAINLAENGFVITQRQSETMLEVKNDFIKFASSRRYFLKKDENIYKEGETLVQKDLAKTLRLIAKEGESAFYAGKIADMIVADMQNNGGIITKEDLASYQAVWRKPIIGKYRGYEIITMGPPSSGGTHILQILNVMQNADMQSLGFASSKSIHLVVEAAKQAFADRAAFMGDPDFIKIPLEVLLSDSYAKKIYANIKQKANKDIKAGMGEIKVTGTNDIKDGDNTTHFSVADKWGNAVSITYTLNKRYGSAAAIEGAGFLINDQMENFAIKSGVPNRHGLTEGENNAIAPQKRPLSSMSPTIILKEGRLFMVVGSPGSGKIITTIVQVISNVIDYKMNIVEAIDNPRFHTQWMPNQIDIEKYGMNNDTKDNLKNMGHIIKESEYMGDVNIIIFDYDKGEFYGAMDPRRKL